VIDRAFGIRVGNLVKEKLESVQQAGVSSVNEETQLSIPLDSIENKVDRVLVAVARVLPPSAHEVNEFFRRQGVTLKLKSDEFTKIVARNSGTKKFFFFNRELRRWELSALGEFRLKQVVKGGIDER